MRITLAVFVVIVAANLGLAAADLVKDAQDQRLAALCKVDVKYCN